MILSKKIYQHKAQFNRILIISCPIKIYQIKTQNFTKLFNYIQIINYYPYDTQFMILKTSPFHELYNINKNIIAKIGFITKITSFMV